MSYVRLIPSIDEYAQKFRQLDSLDFKMISDMYKHGFSNLSKLAESIGIPKQTVSYHSRKLDQHDLVRFRALIDEPKLGLKSYAVIASAALGKEHLSGRALTCFPLWRYLAILEGWKRGNYVRYAIPPDKETDLKAFLEEIKKRNLITDFEIVPTTSPNFPLLNLSFYGKKEGFLLFDWDKWISDFDKFPEEKLEEPADYEKSKFDLNDLIILRCLEINAKTSQRKIVKEMTEVLNDKDYAKFIPLVSRRIRDTIMNEGLIRGYRAYLFPNPVPTTMLVMYRLAFSNSSSLQKFVAGLSRLPYNTGYEKVLSKDELIVRFILPAHEWPSIWDSVTKLAEKGHIKNAQLFLCDLVNKTWDNVEIHQMFKEETWNFSYGIAVEALEKVLRR
jgi:DNA-binding Lrp family transcriptional regulator